MWVHTIEENAHHESFFEREFCSLVAGHDPANTCEKEHALLSIFGKVDCGGRFMNNTTKMWELYGNDKIRFLQDYRYNFALENSDCEGYVTEKIFHTIIACAIPIYCGSANHPEPEILKQERILYFDHSQPDLLETQLSSLQDEDVLRKKFAQPVFKDNAAEKIYERMLILESRIKALF